ncbi:MAG: ribose 5-phosphate isomerase B [Lachnospiraceae bacterium]|nr:ribose 5-phosphate isomerase B [Lachnospiraceae bacterium]
MKVAIGADHGAFDRKREVIDYLKERGHEVKDFGTYTPDSCDYPAIGLAVAKAVASGEYDRGIVMCTTGIGISIVANKVRGIRCALCNDVTSAKLTRAHNDANMLSMGAGVIGPNLTMDIVDVFMNTPFSNEEKHVRRLSQLKKIETEELK